MEAFYQFFTSEFETTMGEQFARECDALLSPAEIKLDLLIGFEQEQAIETLRTAA